MRLNPNVVPGRVFPSHVELDPYLHTRLGHWWRSEGEAPTPPLPYTPREEED